MQLYKRVEHIRAYINYQKALGFKVGFVPTMGALHRGHLSLVEHALGQTEITVASIFVNPTQFNQASDLKSYPRTFREDTDLLYGIGLHALFAPDEKDVYPSEGISTPELDFKGLDEVLEGVYRPGHFAGVAQVVYRLLDIIQPDFLYMGQKDYQQWTLIHQMLQEISSSIKLIMVPTVREADGLAMSSRNLRLTSAWRTKAPKIYQTLLWVRNNIEEMIPSKLCDLAINKLEKDGFRPEYFSIVDGYTLQPVRNISTHEKVVVCVAAWAGEIRLIDNLILKDA